MSQDRRNEAPKTPMSYFQKLTSAPRLDIPAYNLDQPSRKRPTVRNASMNIVHDVNEVLENINSLKNRVKMREDSESPRMASTQPRKAIEEDDEVVMLFESFGQNQTASMRPDLTKTGSAETEIREEETTENQEKSDEDWQFLYGERSSVEQVETAPMEDSEIPEAQEQDPDQDDCVIFKVVIFDNETREPTPPESQEPDGPVIVELDDEDDEEPTVLYSNVTTLEERFKSLEDQLAVDHQGMDEKKMLKNFEENGRRIGNLRELRQRRQGPDGIEALNEETREMQARVREREEAAEKAQSSNKKRPNGNRKRASRR